MYNNITRGPVYKVNTKIEQAVIKRQLGTSVLTLNPICSESSQHMRNLYIGTFVANIMGNNFVPTKKSHQRSSLQDRRGNPERCN